MEEYPLHSSESYSRVDNSFHNLCRIGNLDGVMEYIDNGFDINVRCKSMLHHLLGTR